MSRKLAYAIIVLFVVAAAPGWTGLFWNLHNQNVAARNQYAAQAAARRAALGVERKICADVQTMGALQPPSGSASANPSRAYEQAEHRAWQGLVVAIGCRP